MATACYSTIASERYAARAGFSIRGIDTSAGIDGIGALTGLASSGSTTSDSYIVLSNLASRELVEAVDAELNLRGAYSAADVDPLSRLAPDANVEEFLTYWERRIHTQFDPASGIIEFEVQSFSPEHTRDIADAVLRLGEGHSHSMNWYTEHLFLTQGIAIIERDYLSNPKPRSMNCQRWLQMAHQLSVGSENSYD